MDHYLTLDLLESTRSDRMVTFEGGEKVEEGTASTSGRRPKTDLKNAIQFLDVHHGSLYRQSWGGASFTTQKVKKAFGNFRPRS